MLSPLGVWDACFSLRAMWFDFKKWEKLCLSNWKFTVNHITIHLYRSENSLHHILIVDANLVHRFFGIFLLILSLERKKTFFFSFSIEYHSIFTLGSLHYFLFFDWIFFTLNSTATKKKKKQLTNHCVVVEKGFQWNGRPKRVKVFDVRKQPENAINLRSHRRIDFVVVVVNGKCIDACTIKRIANCLFIPLHTITGCNICGKWLCIHSLSSSFTCILMQSKKHQSASKLSSFTCELVFETNVKCIIAINSWKIKQKTNEKQQWQQQKKTVEKGTSNWMVLEVMDLSADCIDNRPIWKWYRAWGKQHEANYINAIYRHIIKKFTRKST